MATHRTIGLSILPVVLCLAACDGGKVRPPPPASCDAACGEAGPVVPRPPRRDSGPTDAAMDADGSMDGALDAGAPPGCTRYTRPSTTNTATITDGTTALGFEVRAAFARWNADCAAPSLLIGLTDGSCVPGAGEQILLRLRRDAIGVAIFPGPNNLLEEPFDTDIRVLYSRPGVDVWGTCAGVVGDVTFTGMLCTGAGCRLRGTYDAMLTDCADPRTATPVRAVGTFDVTIASRDTCP